MVVQLGLFMPIALKHIYLREWEDETLLENCHSFDNTMHFNAKMYVMYSSKLITFSVSHSLLQ